ncbi:MAG: hypothetical protein Q4615_04705 [Paracoccus aminovorans]|nr:hypothetical protein [Paracoccus aminovorans]
MLKILLLAVMVATIAGPAHAGPVMAAVAWVGSALKGVGIAASLLRVAIGVGASLLSSAIAKATADKPKVDVQFEVDFGDDTPLSFVVGDYATAGKLKYVAGWGKNRRFVTEVIEVSCLPQGYGSIWVGDEAGTPNGLRAYITGTFQPGQQSGWAEAATVPGGSIDMGMVLTNLSDDGNRICVKWVDGTQAAADPLLVWAFGSDDDYPWTAEMIGTGKSYAIVTTRYDSDTLTSKPSWLFKPAPLPMYDPRKDSTAGGSGAHRWGNRSTYEATRNPAVIAYNIARGIYYGSEWIFGGRNLPAWRLPLAEWFAAMNACDATVNLAGGGTEPAFRCGLQIRADMTPADVLEEIGRAANMRFAEVGGMLKPIVGLPGAAVFAFTDESILITEGQSYKPFNGLGETYNALSATYPEPAEKWSTKDAPEYIDTAATAADGGRYLPTSLSYPAAPYRRQVQRLMRAQMRDYRRMRLHQFYLPPEAYALEPLVDMVSWSSERNGYLNKLFVVEQVDPTPGMNVLVTLREVDPSDYDWSSDFELPTTVVTPVTPPISALPISGFVAEGVALQDAGGTNRRPAIRIACNGDETGVTDIQLQVRLSGQTTNIVDVTRPFSDPYQWFVQDVLPAQDYQVRARLLSELRVQSIWTDWTLAITPDIRLGRDDIAEDIIADVDGLLEWMDETDDVISAIQADLAAEAARVDGIVQDVRDELADEAASIRLDLTNGLASANGYTDTAIETYDTTVQGQFSAVAGQIEQLTAALTSENLVSNGKFEADASGWTLTSSARVARTGSSDALVLACPQEGMVGVGVGETGSIEQTLNAFVVDEYDRMQLRFWAASTSATRPVTVAFNWLDSNGDHIGSAASESITVSPANQWRVYTVQVDPPDNAVGAVLTLSKTTGGTRVLVTDIEASTVNIAIEARVTALEAARVTDQDAFATFQDQVDVRFDDADAAITAEASARADADSAMGTRIDAVEAVNGTQQAAIETQATAVSNATEAISQLDTRLSAQFGMTQLVRDPEFASGLTHWSGSLGSDESRIVARNRGGDWWLSQMPAPKAFRFTNADLGAGSLVGNAFEVSISETYDLAFFVANRSGGPSIRAWMQWLDESLAQVGVAGQVTASGPNGSWQQYGASGLVPPVGATRGRVVFQVNAAGAGASGVTGYVTGTTVRKRAASEVATAATIQTVQQAQADADSAFTAYRTTMESRVGDIESVNSAQASAISNRYTRAETDNAISAAISTVTATLTNQINQRATATSVNALTARVEDTEDGLSALSDSVTQVSTRTDQASAQGRLRVTSWATGADAGARIGISARADTSSDGAVAALFIEALTNGNSRVSVVADRFAIVGGTAASPLRSVPFYVQDGAVYIDIAFIRYASITGAHIANLTVDTINIKDGAVTVGHYVTLNGGSATTATDGFYDPFTFSMPAAGRALLYAKCTTFNPALDAANAAVSAVQVNGVDYVSSVRRSTAGGGGTTIFEGTIAVPLVAGSNTIRLRHRNMISAAWQVDVFAFKK